MEQLSKQSNYFSMRQDLKEREQKLAKLLQERLPNSEIGTALFDLLVVRRELVKEALTKEGGDKEKGAAAALKDLLELLYKK